MFQTLAMQVNKYLREKVENEADNLNVESSIILPLSISLAQLNNKKLVVKHAFECDFSHVN